MSEFTLPSGRIVRMIEASEITYGQEVHTISEGLRSPEEFTYLKFAVLVPDLKRDEVAALTRADGRALGREVDRVWNERSLEDDIPKGNGSPQSSMVLNRAKRTQKGRAVSSATAARS